MLEAATENYERHGQANAPLVGDFFWNEEGWEKALHKTSRIEAGAIEPGAIRRPAI